MSRPRKEVLHFLTRRMKTREIILAWECGVHIYTNPERGHYPCLRFARAAQLTDEQTDNERKTKMKRQNMVRFSKPGLHQSGGPIWTEIPGSNPKVWVSLDPFSAPEDVTSELRLPQEIRFLWNDWVELAARTRALHIPSPGDAPVPAIRFAWDPYFYDISSDDLLLTWWEFEYCADHIRQTLADAGCVWSIYFHNQKENRPDGIEKNIGMEWRMPDFLLPLP